MLHVVALVCAVFAVSSTVATPIPAAETENTLWETSENLTLKLYVYDRKLFNALANYYAGSEHDEHVPGDDAANQDVDFVARLVSCEAVWDNIKKQIPESSSKVEEYKKLYDSRLEVMNKSWAAIRGIHELQKMAQENPKKVILTEEAKKLVKHFNDNLPEVDKATTKVYRMILDELPSMRNDLNSIKPYLDSDEFKMNSKLCMQ